MIALQGHTDIIIKKIKKTFKRTTVKVDNST